MKKNNHRTFSREKNYQSGNAFIIILLGVALFAALAFTISRSMRSDTTTRLSQRELTLVATDILNYTQKIERAVNRLRRNGCSENDISFENPFLSGYEHTPPAPEKCKVFGADGGKIAFRSATSFIPGLTREFRFNGNNKFADFGCNTTGDARCAELVISLRLNENPAACLEINNRLGTENPSGDAPRFQEWTFGSAFTGTFSGAGGLLVGGANATNEAPQLYGKSAGCFFEFAGGQDTYYFYSILIAR